MTFGQLPYDVAHLLGGGMLLLSFMLLYQRRVGAVINALALQGAILAAAAAWQGVVQDAPQLYLTAPLPGEAPPLFVMLHGCDQDAAGFAAGTRMNELAEECHGVVLYPEQCRMVNPMGCWNWHDMNHQSAAHGEPSLKQRAGELMRFVERHVEKVGVRRQRLVAELAQPRRNALALFEERTDLGRGLQRRDR